MATVRELINDSLIELGVVASDTPLDDSDALIGFRESNRMLGTWSNDRVMIYAITGLPLTLVAGTASYSTSLLGARPVRVEDQKIVDSNSVVYPLAFVPYESFNAIAYPPAPGIPRLVLRQPNFPQDTYTFYPTPIGGLVAHFYAWSQLTAFATIGDTVTLPPGYEDCIVKNLAIRLAPSFRTQARPETIESARAALAGVMAANLPDVELSLAHVPVAHSASFNWYSGEST